MDIPKRILTDQDEMLFGIHEGKKIEEVPAKYLLWSWDEYLRLHVDRSTFKGALARYVRDNFHALETEATDYIVKHKP